MCLAANQALKTDRAGLRHLSGFIYKQSPWLRVRLCLFCPAALSLGYMEIQTQMITKQEIVAISIRILALYMFLQGLSILPMSVTIGTANPVSFLISHEFVTFLISVILWIIAFPLAKFMLKEKINSPEMSSSLSRETIEQTVFSIVGLIIAAVSIPGLSSLFAYHSALDSLNSDPSFKVEALAGFKGHLVRYIIQIIIGLFLLFYSNIVTGLIGRIRGTAARENSI